ncbi:hypothetical protein D3C79_981690 [compost metagenome]
MFTHELERMIDFISNAAKVDTATGSILLSTMVATLVLARSVNDCKLSDCLLTAGKQHAKGLIKT